jgi:hypothetical protein
MKHPEMKNGLNRVYVNHPTVTSKNLQCRMYFLRYPSASLSKNFRYPSRHSKHIPILQLCALISKVLRVLAVLARAGLQQLQACSSSSVTLVLSSDCSEDIFSPRGGRPALAQADWGGGGRDPPLAASTAESAGCCGSLRHISTRCSRRSSTSGTPTRYIVSIYHVYSMYMYCSCICLAYTTYIHLISKFHFHVFMRNSMLHTKDMVEDNIMLKPEMYKKAQFAIKIMYQTYLVYT